MSVVVPSLSRPHRPSHGAHDGARLPVPMANRSLGVAVQYYLKTDTDTKVWSPAITVDGTQRAWDLAFFRLRPGAE